MGAQADVVFSNVWKTFPGSPEPTLAGLDIEVAPQTIHTLIGHSGSGKSVTIRHLLGLIAPDDGEILIKGKNITRISDYDLREVRENFGMLFQNSALFDSLSVFENIAFPLREHRRDWSEEKIEKRVMDLLGMVELPGAANKYPSEISGGMQKRVGLARAIALDPKILLFDEPTTGLDPTTAQVIDDLIVFTKKHLNASAFIISHDIHAALRISDFVSMLWKGKIIETASPKNFVKSEHEVVQKFLASAGIT